MMSWFITNILPTRRRSNKSFSYNGTAGSTMKTRLVSNSSICHDFVHKYTKVFILYILYDLYLKPISIYILIPYIYIGTNLMETFNPTTFKVLNFSYCGLDCLNVALHFPKNSITGLYEPLCHEHFVKYYQGELN